MDPKACVIDGKQPRKNNILPCLMLTGLKPSGDEELNSFKDLTTHCTWPVVGVKIE